MTRHLRLVEPQTRATIPTPLGWPILYHPGIVNFCPGCGKRQWLIGRNMAECAFCATALPIGPERKL